MTRPDDMHPSKPGPEVARSAQCFEVLNARQMRRDRAADRARIVAWAEGFAEAREMAAQVCATHGVLGGPTPNPYACWKVHADNIAAAIRALIKEKPHE